MKLDKRVIECGAVTVFLGVMAVATSVAQTKVPVRSNEVSTKIYKEAEEMASANTSCNAGLALSFENGNIYSVVDVMKDDIASIEATQTDVVASDKTTDSEWADRVMAKVDEYVNIRSEANEESEILGKLYKGSAADIIERGDGWTKITSGSVEGYIKSEFLAFDEEAKVLADEEGTLVATILTDTLRVRREAAADSSVVGLVGMGEKLNALSADEVNGFIEVEFEGETAYVSGEFTSVELLLGKAISIEEEQKKIAAERAKKAWASHGAPSYSQLSAVDASVDETTLLAALIYCEAGNQSYEGKLAVGAVVMNRVRSGAYPNNITDVIYQSGQFTPALNGKVASVIASGAYGGSCYAAAQEAISGVSNVGNAIGFAFASSGRSGTVIDGVVFF